MIIVSGRVVRAIQSIKEVVKDHSDADIYIALQQTNMDPNETAQLLLNQDPFHEVRRKRDKKKDVRLSQNTGYRSSTEARKPIERVEQSMKSNPTDLNVPRGGYSRNVVAGGSREFRVVRDNRVNKNVSREVKPPSPRSSTSTSGQRSLQVSEKGSSTANQKSSSGNHMPRQASQSVSHTVLTQVQGAKPNDSKQLSAVLASNHSVVGVYSSSSDPVHVPSPESRSAANVGAIKRELGAVGVRRQNSSAQSNTVSTSNLGKDGIASRESLKSSAVTSTTDQPSQKTSQPEPVLPNMSGSRPSSGNQYNSRSHQQVAGHQKASQPAKEWKRKSGSKSNNNGHGVIGSHAKTVSHPADSSQLLEIDAAHVQDKPSLVDVCMNQNVFIAEHIRVSDSDRSRLTFGSFGTEVDSSRTTASESLIVREGESPSTRVSTSLSASIPGSPTVETSASKHVDVLDDQVRNSDSNSPASGGLSENLLLDRKSISSPKTLDNYADIGLVHDNSPSFTRTEPQQQQDHPELASFSVYDPQAGYNIPYFRPSMDEPVRGQGLPSPQEAMGSHMANNIPVSSIPMVQQQQQQQQAMAQMYQQMHVSPFANIMPYRQYISPVYGPPIPMTGYSPHPSNGNSFLLMPGGSSHLGAANNLLKYGFKPPGTPTDDSSRLKYKDGNLFLPNPQAELIRKLRLSNSLYEGLALNGQQPMLQNSVSQQQEEKMIIDRLDAILKMTFLSNKRKRSKTAWENVIAEKEGRPKFVYKDPKDGKGDDEIGKIEEKLMVDIYGRGFDQEENEEVNNYDHKSETTLGDNQGGDDNAGMEVAGDDGNDDASN